MATKLYIRNTPSQDAVGTDLTNLLDKNADGAIYGHVKNTVAGAVTPPTTATQFTKTAAGTVETWLSPPVNAITISGSVTFNIWALESIATANATVTAELYRCDNGGSVLSTIAAVNTTNAELTTSAAAMNWSVTPTSTALSAGDRLAVRVFIDDGSGVTMTSGRTVTANINGIIAAASGDTYVQVTESVTYQNPTLGMRQEGLVRKTTAGTTAAVALNDVQVGNRIVVMVNMFGAATISSVTDSASNNGAGSGYDNVVTTTQGSNQLRMACYTVPVTTGGDLTITMTESASTTFATVFAGEYAGLSTDTGSSAWDGSATGGNTTIPATTNMSAGPTAAASANGQAVAFWGDTASTVQAPGKITCTATGYLQRGENILGGSNLNSVLYDHQTTSGNTETVSFQTTSSDSGNFWAAVVVAFKPAAAATSVPPPVRIVDQAVSRAAFV